MLALAACSTLDRAAAGAGKALKRVCEQTSAPVRDDALARVNAAAAPHSATLNCVSPEPPG